MRFFASGLLLQQYFTFLWHILNGPNWLQIGNRCKLHCGCRGRKIQFVWWSVRRLILLTFTPKMPMTCSTQQSRRGIGAGFWKKMNLKGSLGTIMGFLDPRKSSKWKLEHVREKRMENFTRCAGCFKIRKSMGLFQLGFGRFNESHLQ